jgi:hypothetical protein
MIKVQKLESFPAGANPFHYDHYQMGAYHSSNSAVMFSTFDKDKAAHIDIINRETGERIRVHFGPGHFGKFIEKDDEYFGGERIQALMPEGTDFSDV